MIMKQNEEIEKLKIKNKEMEQHITNQDKRINELSNTIITLQSNIIENNIIENNIGKINKETDFEEPLKPKFNLENYLKVDCANAVDIMQFIKNITPTAYDYELFLTNNTRVAMGLLFKKYLNQIKNQTECPIQVTDARRNHFMIKYKGEWIDSKTGYDGDGNKNSVFYLIAKRFGIRTLKVCYEVRKSIFAVERRESIETKWDKIIAGVCGDFYYEPKDLENFINQIIKGCNIHK